MQLPQDLSIQDFAKNFRTFPELWKAAVLEICTSHQITTTLFQPYSGGSNIVSQILIPEWEKRVRSISELENLLMPTN